MQKTRGMAGFDLEDVTRIARNAARGQAVPLEVVGVVPAGRGDDYVEILVSIDGCSKEPCRFALGAFRNASETDLQREIGIQLREHLLTLEKNPPDKSGRSPSSLTQENRNG